MSRDKSVWFAEEILLDAKLINYQLESGEWDAVEEMLRAEAQLSRDAETGRLRPKKASEYTLRLIAEVLHIMRLDVEQGSYNRATLAVAQQCLRLIRSCAAAGTKMQTYVSKDLGILDSMLALCVEHQQATSHPSSLPPQLLRQFHSCCVVLIQTLGNLVVNNPFNQILIWDKFDAVILNALVAGNDDIASAAAMIVYNILLGQPNVLPDDPVLLNSLSDMYANGNTEYPHLIIEYLIGVENTYIEKLYSKLEPECRSLVLSLAYNILVSNQTQDINVSGNFVRFMAHEFKSKSDLILKTVDKYVSGVEPQEVVFLLDILATAAGMDSYLDTLQSDSSLFINCAFLLRAIHKLGKESDNFFTSINKLYENTGRAPPGRFETQPTPADTAEPQEIPLSKNESTDNVLLTADTMSECTESESSEQFYECSETPLPSAPQSLHALDTEVKSKRSASIDRSDPLYAAKLEQDLVKVAFVKKLEGGEERWPGRKVSLEHKIDIDDGEPPLILDPLPPEASLDNSPDEPITEIHLKAPMLESPSEISPPLAEPLLDTLPPPSIIAPAAATVEVPKPVKKSQNLSTDFNLSEQLEKILGKSTKGEVRDTTIPEEAPTPRPPPSVKIDSPDDHKSRLDETDTTNVKRVVSNVCTVEQHVAFGFKASLVRLLANLCWKHPHNKTLMRELEVIPVLLDCCNIDMRNPLIMQWVIFAVRNLCENCPENQEVISKMTLQSPVQSELLQEMGLTLHADANGRTLKVAPLKTA